MPNSGDKRPEGDLVDPQVREAAYMARQQYLQNIALGMMQQARTLKIAIMTAVASEELAPDVRNFLKTELLQAAAHASIQHKGEPQ